MPELVVENPLDASVLLYDGEELVGAKQNRILNVSVLVAAGATLPIPVSCVEEGRWSLAERRLRRRAAHLACAPATPQGGDRSPPQPLARGVAQGDVWDEVRAKQARLGVDSPTGANRDTFEAHRRSRCARSRTPSRLEPGQCGAVLALGDDLCLDAVSRPDAFARLWPKLRAGYLLDALERLDGRATSVERIAAFVDAVGEAPVTRGPSVGLGEDLRLRGAGLIGSGLELDGEPIQLSAFTSDDGGGGPSGGSRGRARGADGSAAGATGSRRGLFSGRDPTDLRKRKRSGSCHVMKASDRPRERRPRACAELPR